MVIVSAASGGQDTMPVGGAISDGLKSFNRAHKKKIKPEKDVEDGQSYKTLHKLGDHLEVAKVTAQIGDFMLALRDHDDTRDPRADNRSPKGRTSRR
jgi:hypothetical protein